MPASPPTSDDELHQTSGVANQAASALKPEQTHFREPTVGYRFQQYMHSQICRPISEHFYNGRLTTHPDNDKRPSGVCARQFAKKNFGVTGNIVFIDVFTGCETVKATDPTSIVNYDNVRVIGYLIELMVFDLDFRDQFMPRDIMVVSTCSSQTEVHRHAQEDHTEGSVHRVYGCQHINIFNIDLIRRADVGVIILDIARTDGLDALANGDSWIGKAVSRARDFLIIVGRLTRIWAINQLTPSAVGNFINDLKQRNMIYRLSSYDCHPTESLDRSSSFHGNCPLENTERQVKARERALDRGTDGNAELALIHADNPYSRRFREKRNGYLV